MKKNLLILFGFVCPLVARCQSGDFPFGIVSYKELEMKTYPADTNAIAIVLSEFGKARFNDNVDLVFDYHVKIKILKKEGLEKGNFAVLLRKEENVASKEEMWRSLEATTFNLESNRIVESKIDPKNFFLEEFDKNFNVAKFALPGVQVGSVIEVKYTTESPYWFQFHTWEFQDDIPKIHSEFWAYIPANFTYSITLKGFYKLTKTSVEEVEECFHMPNATGNSPCSLGKYVMENLPSFKEEQFMTAKRNFLSAIYFELSQIIEPGGSKTNYSEEWKDVDQKLRVNDYFGLKIKKAKTLMRDIVGPLVATESDELKKAKIVYDYFQKHYTWNDEIEKYSDEDVNKIYSAGKGSSADINLALVGALQSIGLNADPVLVSTRDHGTPFKEHPQRTDFNDVVSSLKVGEQLYLLDATDRFLPFGTLPIRCLNDQGRLISRDESQWVDLKPIQKQKNSISMDLKLNEKGSIKGNLVLQYFGYDAVEERRRIGTAESKESYFRELIKNWNGLETSNYVAENQEDLSKPLIAKMEIELTGDNFSSGIVYLNPYFIDRWETNPFKTSERLYPVDFGAPIETSYFVNLELPESMRVEEAPASASFALPNGGGKCLVNVTSLGKKVSIGSIISLVKSIYPAEEYHHLKEFYSRIIQLQQSQFVFKKAN